MAAIKPERCEGNKRIQREIGSAVGARKLKFCAEEFPAESDVTSNQKLEIRDRDDTSEDKHRGHDDARECCKNNWMRRTATKRLPTGQEKGHKHEWERAKEDDSQKPKQANLDFYYNEQDPKKEKREGNQTIV